MRCPELMGEAVPSSFSTVTQTSVIHVNHQGSIKNYSVVLPSFALKRSFQQERIRKMQLMLSLFESKFREVGVVRW